MRYWRFSTQERGLTLVEILTVLFIVSLLFGMVLAVYANAIKGGRSAATRTLLQRVGKALINYKQTYGTYPIVPGGNLRLENFRLGADSVAFYEADTQYNYFYSADASTSRVYTTSGNTGTDQGIYTELLIGTEGADVMTSGGDTARRAAVTAAIERRP